MMGLSYAALLVIISQIIPVLCNPTPEYFSSFIKSVSRAAFDQPTWWLSQIARKGTVAYGSPNYQIYRNVKDFGAKGDGVTDDTSAINAAITQGNRCGKGCDSSTLTPALVYFPPGTYIVSRPIIQYYYTQLVGDAISHPKLKAAPGFTGIAVIDSDPYENDGSNWYTNQVF